MVSVSSGYREATQSWSPSADRSSKTVDEPPRLVIADGHLGIWRALRKADLLDKIPKGRHKVALLMLRQIPYAETRQEAERVKGRFKALVLAREDWRQRLI